MFNKLAFICNREKLIACFKRSKYSVEDEKTTGRREYRSSSYYQTVLLGWNKYPRHGRFHMNSCHIVHVDLFYSIMHCTQISHCYEYNSWYMVRISQIPPLFTRSDSLRLVSVPSTEREFLGLQKSNIFENWSLLLNIQLTHHCWGSYTFLFLLLLPVFPKSGWSRGNFSCTVLSFNFDKHNTLLTSCNFFIPTFKSIDSPSKFTE